MGRMGRVGDSSRRTLTGTLGTAVAVSKNKNKNEKIKTNKNTKKNRKK